MNNTKKFIILSFSFLTLFTKGFALSPQSSTKNDLKRNIPILEIEGFHLAKDALPADHYKELSAETVKNIIINIAAKIKALFAENAIRESNQELKQLLSYIQSNVDNISKNELDKIITKMNKISKAIYSSPRAPRAKVTQIIGMENARLLFIEFAKAGIIDEEYNLKEELSLEKILELAAFNMKYHEAVYVKFAIEDSAIITRIKKIIAAEVKNYTALDDLRFNTSSDFNLKVSYDFWDKFRKSAGNIETLFSQIMDNSSSTELVLELLPILERPILLLNNYIKMLDIVAEWQSPSNEIIAIGNNVSESDSDSQNTYQMMLMLSGCQRDKQTKKILAPANIFHKETDLSTFNEPDHSSELSV